MENSLKGLILAAGVIITCVVVTLGFYIANEAKQTASDGAGEIGALNLQFAEGDKLIYDGMQVSGTEVINVIKKMSSEDIGICVTNAKGVNYYGHNFNTSTGEVVTTGTVVTYTAALNDKAPTYISPRARFIGSVVRDKNKAIAGICFSQV